MTDPRCVIDTNGLISGVLSDQGKPNRVVSHVIKDFPPSPFQGIPILRPAEFVELIQAGT